MAIILRFKFIIRKNCVIKYSHTVLFYALSLKVLGAYLYATIKEIKQYTILKAIIDIPKENVGNLICIIK